MADNSCRIKLFHLVKPSHTAFRTARGRLSRKKRGTQAGHMRKKNLRLLPLYPALDFLMQIKHRLPILHFCTGSAIYFLMIIFLLGAVILRTEIRSHPNFRKRRKVLWASTEIAMPLESRIYGKAEDLRRSSWQSK